MRFLKDNEKKLFRNLEHSNLKLERNKSHLMFNETCHIYYKNELSVSEINNEIPKLKTKGIQ